MMSNAGDFWAMGGYAAFVWPAYAVAIAALALLLVTALRALRQAERALAAHEGARGRRRAPATIDQRTGNKPAGDLA
jgi:heme exporter protein D